MSIRAHRVIEIKFDKKESFNLWHDGELMDFLDGYSFYSDLDDSCCGITTIPIEALEEAIKQLNLEDHLIKSLKEDIAKADNDGYIQYYCF